MTTTTPEQTQLTRVRRELFGAATTWHRRFEAATQTAVGADGETTVSAMGNPGDLMASNYAYTLAAVLRLVEEAAGTEVAAEIAARADEIMSNGDFDDVNADLTP